MQSAKITQLAIDALKSGKYDQVRINFPNPDMVGHTGDLDATIEACTTVDACVKVSPHVYQSMLQLPGFTKVQCASTTSPNPAWSATQGSLMLALKPAPPWMPALR